MRSAFFLFSNFSLFTFHFSLFVLHSSDGDLAAAKTFDCWRRSIFLFLSLSHFYSHSPLTFTLTFTFPLPCWQPCHRENHAGGWGRAANYHTKHKISQNTGFSFFPPPCTRRNMGEVCFPSLTKTLLDILHSSCTSANSASLSLFSDTFCVNAFYALQERTDGSSSPKPSMSLRLMRLRAAAKRRNREHGSWSIVDDHIFAHHKFRMPHKGEWPRDQCLQLLTCSTRPTRSDSGVSCPTGFSGILQQVFDWMSLGSETNKSNCESYEL